MSHRHRLDLHLPDILWQILQRLSKRWNVTPDAAIRRLIAEAEGEETHYPKPGTRTKT